MRAARAFLRAAVFLCIAPREAALSIVRTSSRCSAAIVSVSPVGRDGLEPLRAASSRSTVAQVLEALALGAPDPLLLLSDVRHLVLLFRRNARHSAGGRKGSRGHSYTRRVETRADGRRLAWSTAIFSAATGLSRVLGLVREIVAANYFGARGRSTPSRSRSRSRTSFARSSPTPPSPPPSSRSSASCSRRASGRAPGASPRRSSGSCCSVSAGSRPCSSCRAR